MATRTTVDELERQKLNNTSSLTSNQLDCKMKPAIVNKNLKPGQPKSTPQPMNNDQQENADGRHGIQSHKKELGIQTNNTPSLENKAQLKDNSLSNVPMKASDNQVTHIQTEKTASVRSENIGQPAYGVVNSQVPPALSNFPFKPQMSKIQPQNSENAQDITSQSDRNKQDISKVNKARFSCEAKNLASILPSMLNNSLPTQPAENKNKTNSDFGVYTDGENMSLASFSSLSLDSILSPELETGSMTTEGINFQHREVISEVPLAVVKPTAKCINPSDTNNGASCEQTTPKEVMPSPHTDPVPSYASLDGQQSIPDLLADLQRIAIPAVQCKEEGTVRSDNGASSEQTTPKEVLPANTDPDTKDDCSRIYDLQSQIPQRMATPAVKNTKEGMVRKYNGACSEQMTAEEVVSANTHSSVNRLQLVVNQRIPEQIVSSADPSPSSFGGQQSMVIPEDPQRMNIPESPSSLDIDGPQSMMNEDIPQEMAALSHPNAGKMSDFVMLHTDADLEDACAYLDHLQEHSGFPDLTMDLFSNTDFGKSDINSLASLHNKYRYILIYVTQNLTSDSYCRFLQEILLKIGLKQGNGKEDRVIPVFTQTGGCDIPELDVLIGLNYFWFLSTSKTVKEHYIKNVQKLIRTGRAKFPD